MIFSISIVLNKHLHFVYREATLGNKLLMTDETQ